MHISKKNLIFLLCFVFWKPVFAVENAGLCPDLFSDGKYRIFNKFFVELKSDQILIRGQLTAHWETGMEGFVLWSVSETAALERNIYSDPIYALHKLNNRSQLFIFDSNGRLVFDGYYGEAIKSKVVRVGSRFIDTFSNRPQLFYDKELKQLKMDSTELKQFFAEKRSVVVIKTPDEHEKKLIETEYKPGTEKLIKLSLPE